MNNCENLKEILAYIEIEVEVLHAITSRIILYFLPLIILVCNSKANNYHLKIKIRTFITIITTILIKKSRIRKRSMSR